MFFSNSAERCKVARQSDCQLSVRHIFWLIAHIKGRAIKLSVVPPSSGRSVPQSRLWAFCHLRRGHSRERTRDVCYISYEKWRGGGAKKKISKAIVRCKLGSAALLYRLKAGIYGDEGESNTSAQCRAVIKDWSGSPVWFVGIAPPPFG